MLALTLVALDYSTACRVWAGKVRPALPEIVGVVARSVVVGRVDVVVGMGTVVWVI